MRNCFFILASLSAALLSFLISGMVSSESDLHAPVSARRGVMKKEDSPLRAETSSQGSVAFIHGELNRDADGPGSRRPIHARLHPDRHGGAESLMPGEAHGSITRGDVAAGVMRSSGGWPPSEDSEAPCMNGIASPGDYFVADGLTVSIAEVLPGLGNDSRKAGDLELVLDPNPAVTKVNPLPAPATGRPPFGRGFTQEEELFRAKWGWDAYDEAFKFATESKE